MLWLGEKIFFVGKIQPLVVIAKYPLQSKLFFNLNLCQMLDEFVRLFPDNGLFRLLQPFNESYDFVYD